MLGSAVLGAALVCGVGLAKAQDYGPPPGYHDDYRGPPPESVIVHPYYGDVEKRQLTGHINGEVDPTEYRLSRSVGFGDLDLSNPADRAELRIRVHETAQDLCFQLDARVPQLRGDASADRECIRQAMREAMRDVYYGRG